VTQQILIVDNMEAFATILKEGIEGGGDYEATVVTTAAEAREIAPDIRPALVIVDLGLQDEDAVELLAHFREIDPDLRLIVIPVDELPQEVTALEIQGTLSKPFFLPDIPAQIEEALSRAVGAPFVAPEPEPEATVVSEAPAAVVVGAASPTIEAAQAAETMQAAPAVTTDASAGALPSSELLAHLADVSPRLTHHLRHLSRELNADAVMLTCGAELVAYAGHFGQADAERLAHVVSESWQASARVAAALGKKDVRFEQSLHEGEDYLLYSLAAAVEVVLSVALHADRPLGMIRYNTKQTVEAMQPLLLL